MSAPTGSALSPQEITGLRIPPERKRRSPFASLLIVPVLLALVVALWFVFQKTKGGDSQRLTPRKASAKTPAVPTPAAKAPARLTPETAPKGEKLFVTSGYIVPRERLELSPRFQATVAEIRVGKGDRVKAGDIVVKLEDEEYRARVEEAQARVVLAEAQLLELRNGTRPEEIERARWQIAQWEANLKGAEQTLARRIELARLNGASREQVDEAQKARDSVQAQLNMARQELALAEKGARAERIAQAEAELAVARAAVESATVFLRWCTITSPIDGTILTRDVDAGELVTPQSFGGSRGPSTSFVSMANLSDLQVQVDLNEQFTSQVFLDQLCEVSPLAYPDRKYRAYVFEIAPEANRAKGTLEVKVQILQPDEYLTPELSATVSYLNDTAPEAAEDRPARRRRTQ